MIVALTQLLPFLLGMMFGWRTEEDGASAAILLACLNVFASLYFWIRVIANPIILTSFGRYLFFESCICLASLSARMFSIILAPIRMQFPLLILPSLSPFPPAIGAPGIATIDVAIVFGVVGLGLLLIAALAYFRLRCTHLPFERGLFRSAPLNRSFILFALRLWALLLRVPNRVTLFVQRSKARLAPGCKPIMPFAVLVELRTGKIAPALRAVFQIGYNTHVRLLLSLAVPQVLPAPCGFLLPNYSTSGRIAQ